MEMGNWETSQESNRRWAQIDADGEREIDRCCLMVAFSYFGVFSCRRHGRFIAAAFKPPCENDTGVSRSDAGMRVGILPIRAERMLGAPLANASAVTT